MIIRQASHKDIPIIEEILLDAVDWMDRNGLHQWERQAVQWETLSMYYRAEDFCIALKNAQPAACMAVVDYDPHFWPEIAKGESLFLHKLAVKRAFAGKGVSKQLIDYAKDKAIALGINDIRLDCHQNRDKVRALYERQGFVCEGEKILFEKYEAAFYVCHLTNV